MLTGMGLALGIDYSLFVVSRYREERLHGLAKEDAIARAGATASRAVLFSGSTFVVALVGMFIVPTSIMRSLALGAILVGIVSVAAALTLLPALLERRRRRCRQAARADPRPEPRSHRTRRRPVLAADRRGCVAAAGVVPRRRCRGDAGGRARRSSACISAQTASARCRPVSPRGRGTNPCSAPSRPRTRSPRGSSSSAAVPPPSCAAISHGSIAGSRATGSFGAGTIQTSAGDSVALLTSPVRGDPVGGAAVKAVRDLRSERHPVDLRRQRSEGLRRRRDRGERRLLRRRDEPDSVRPPVRSRTELHPAHGRVPLARRRARLGRCSTCSRSARRTGC